MKKWKLYYLLAACFVVIGCKNCKKDDVVSPTPPEPPPTNNDTICLVSRISQTNSGFSSESSLNAYYNSTFNVTKIIIYDSLDKTKNFEADLNYITSDSIRIDQYQYLLLDSNKRVIKLVTKSDLKDPINADNYVFQYEYNGDGYLATKDLYINGSILPNLTTIYTYANNLLSKCEMIAVSSGNLKSLESSISYDQSQKIKNWIYTFPDAIEGYMYLAVLNFGKRAAYPPKQIITKIYDPPSGNLIDTWTTNYSNYKIDSYGYITSGVADGDLQEGIASFYGKTNFYYDCH